MKIYEKHRLVDQMKRRAVQREIIVMKKLAHPNLPLLHDLLDTPKQIYLIMDFVKGMSLKEFTKM